MDGRLGCRQSFRVTNNSAMNISNILRAHLSRDLWDEIPGSKCAGLCALAARPRLVL